MGTFLAKCTALLAIWPQFWKMYLWKMAKNSREPHIMMWLSGYLKKQICEHKTRKSNLTNFCQYMTNNWVCNWKMLYVDYCAVKIWSRGFLTSWIFSKNSLFNTCVGSNRKSNIIKVKKIGTLNCILTNNLQYCKWYFLKNWKNLKMDQIFVLLKKSFI